jgi:hypothetical protein
LHQTLSHHDALPVMAINAFPGVRLKHGADRFLELQEQGLVPLGHHQGDPASPTHAADANHLDCDINESIAIEQYAPILKQRLSVSVKKLFECCLSFGGTRRSRMKDQWWSVRNADLSGDGTRELGKVKFRTTSARCPFDPLLDAPLQGLRQRFDKV